MKAMRDLICDLRERVVEEVVQFPGTVLARTVQTVISLLVRDPELLKYAVSDGTKAVTRYASEKEKPPGWKSRHGLWRRGRIAFSARPAYDRFHVTKKRVSYAAAVYLTAFLEYIVAELLELSAAVTKKDGRVQITCRHIMIAVESDSALKQLFGGTFSRGGVYVAGKM